MKLLTALILARDAIAKHRDAIHGPDYDYEKDEVYEPEAELYRVLPQLDARITKALGKPKPKKEKKKR